MFDIRKKDGLELLTQVVLILLGVYFISLRETALVHITTLLGILMTAGGAACILRAFIKKEQGSLFLSMPVLLAVGGIVLLIFRKQATEVVPFCIGIWALVLGTVKLVITLQYLMEHVSLWWVQAIPAFLGILMGILILTGKVNLNAVFTVLMGVYLMLLGVFNIVDFFVFRRRMPPPDGFPEH